MNVSRLFAEIWFADRNWTLGYDKFRGIYMYNVITGVAMYADTVEDVARKVWLLIYVGADTTEHTYTVIPPSHGMVKG